MPGLALYAPVILKEAVRCGLRVRLTPAASAVSHTQDFRSVTAQWMATREEEQAVSIDIEAPFSPKR